MKVDTDVFVIGAGPAGLTAAYCLTKETPSVMVIEKDPVYVGGISRTVTYNGFSFDIGGHRFFSKSKEVVDLWKEILPDDFISRPRLSRIYYGGKYYSYPLKAFEALMNLGIFTSALCMASYAYAKAFPIKDAKTFHQWVRNQFGEKLFSIFFRTYTEKVWGMSCDEISADWAAQRIKGLDLGSAVMNALKKSLGAGAAKGPDGKVIKTLIESFEYPRKGPGMMWEAAARKVEERGGKVLMGREFSGMRYDANRKVWSIDVTTAEGKAETYTARHVISSAPVRELVEKIKPTPISLLHARQLRYRDFLTVALMVKKPDLFPDNWIYIHDPSVKVGRVQNFRSWSPELVPSADMSCLGLEYFCFEGDGLWNSPDSELVRLAKQECAKIGLVREDEVTDSCVVRQHKAYPVYDDAYRDNMNMIRLDLETSYPTLHLVGRNGMHKYNNQDHAMMTAMLTAKNILAGQRLYDVWNVNEDAEYHESGMSGVEEALKSERLVPAKVSAKKAA
jgi:protoporphyrinogen oxidase